MAKVKAKTDVELVAELRQFHHYEAARRLEQLARFASAAFVTRDPEGRVVDPPTET
jgi:hypothetical protein